MKKANKDAEIRNLTKARLADKMELPKDLLLGAINIKVIGKWEMLIENYKSIIEYTDTVIKVQGKDTRIKIIGKNLQINCYSKEDMEIEGIINEIIYY